MFRESSWARWGKLLQMQRAALLLTIVTATVVASCAPRMAPPPVVTSPRYPDYIRPSVPPNLLANPAVAGTDRSWSYLQAGDLDAAQREVDAVLSGAPAFYPAAATAGYVALARRRADQALTHFDRALGENPQYVSALVGKGEALVVLERDRDAITAFESALNVEPALGDLRRRVEVLKFREFEKDIAAARDAAKRGRTEAAVTAYQSAIARSPDSAFRYRELADVERRAGSLNDALAHFREAVRLDPSDTASMLAIAETLESSGNVNEAIAAYDQVLLVEPSAAIEGRRDRLRARVELESLPPQYQAIASAPVATRGDLAALIGVRLGTLLQPRSELVVLQDMRGHWAQSWIQAVASAGVIEPYANRNFGPGDLVTRDKLAEAVAALLPLVAAPQEVSNWRAVPGRFSDLSQGHLKYADVSIAVASGVMKTLENQTFQPSRSVTGAEATEAVERLRSMAESSGRVSARR